MIIKLVKTAAILGTGILICCAANKLRSAKWEKVDVPEGEKSFSIEVEG